ncbi:hypothetical protein PNA2_0628 [Pyrococcus sp. NA2]|uniref:ArnT family glycosyltransferase n=1 Tax=Pyrococcus sp. (strain NA2) TaxID=342949 RepID=UPI000209AC3A|nr:glycosyltransferase family 39 protein [Pyrococcus sp. NA2]AEC51544.1 hypothetical protein PNA2_0628 [Pyrococcus sp. NA2]
MKDRVGILIFMFSLGLGILALAPEKSLTYDGALYINIARNLARDITSFTYQGVYMMYRPPLYPYTLSLIFRFIHSNHLLIARLVSAVSFALTSLILYYLVKDMFGSDIKGIIASLFYVFNPLAFTMAGRELVHSEFTLFYTLAIYLLYMGRKRDNALRIYLAFISAGLAILTRYTGLSIILVFLAYLWLVDHWNWVKKREYLIGFGLLFPTLLPWLYMGHLYYGGFFRPFKIASRVVTLDKPVSAFEYIGMVIKDIGYVLPALATLGFLRIKKDEQGWLILSWLVIGGGGILAVTHKETRFITFLSPVIAILASEGISLIAEQLKGKWKTIGSIAIALLLIVPIGMKAKELKGRWDGVGVYESEALRYASNHYKAERLLVSPYLYTMAGYYYPNARIEMILKRKDVEEKIAKGYYDVIIHKDPNVYLNIETCGNYVLVKEFYGGRIKIYVKSQK